MSTRAAVVTVSSSLARGEGEDVSGPALVRLCEAAGLEVQHEVVSDDRESILAALKRLADHDGVRFIFTTGGTGLTVDDVTPEATPRRDRPRGARLRGGDPGRLARAHAARPAHARRVGRARPHADREPAGQPEGDRAVMADRGADAGARGAAAGARQLAGQALVAQLPLRRLRLPELLQAHPGEHRGRLRELDLGVLDDLDAVAPRVAEVQAVPGSTSTPASWSACRTRARSSTTRPKWRSRSGVPGLLCARARNWSPMSRKAMPGTRPRSSRLEDAAVELDRLVHVADGERDVVDPDHPRHGRSIGFRAWLRSSSNASSGGTASGSRSPT